MIGFIVAALCATGFYQTMLPYFTTLINALFARHHKKIEAASSVQTKEAVDGTAVLQHLASRVDTLEKRLDEADRRNDRLERVVERLANGYKDARRKLMWIVRLMREGKIADAHELDDIENNTPDVKEVLEGVLNVSE